MDERYDLYYQQAGSDKVYIVAMTEHQPGHYDVICYYGRRGSTLNKAVKTASPLSRAGAAAVFDRCVKEKLKKGYQRSTVPLASIPGLGTSLSSAARPAASPSPEMEPIILPQLLNAVRDDAQLEELILDPDWWAQEKKDGERRLASNAGGKWFGINKKGKSVQLPASVERNLAENFAADTLLDGELIGDVYHVFDVLRWAGHDLTGTPVDHRASYLARIACSPSIVAVPYWQSEDGKRTLLANVRQAGGEGVVFKRFSAAYTPGRPNSGGDQLKHKFVESATVVVAKLNATKRSVAIGGFDDDGHMHNLGNVTIPPNHEIPSKGDIVEVRYLYAYKGGSLYQPVYLGKRSDQDANDCSLSQLKYKRLILNAEAKPEGDARWAW